MIENLKVQNIRNRFPKKKGYCVTQFTMEFSRRKNKEASQQTKRIQNAYLPHFMWENQHICNCII